MPQILALLRKKKKASRNDVSSGFGGEGIDLGHTIMATRHPSFC